MQRAAVCMDPKAHRRAEAARRVELLLCTTAATRRRFRLAPIPQATYMRMCMCMHTQHVMCTCARARVHVHVQAAGGGLTGGGSPHCRSASRLALPRRATGARHAPVGLDRAPLRGGRARARAREALLVLLGSAHERGRAARVGRAARARQRRRRRRPRGLIDFDFDADAHPAAPRRTGPLELGGAFGRGGGGGGLLGGGPQEVGPGTHRVAAWGRVRAAAAHGWAGLQGQARGVAVCGRRAGSAS